MLYSSKTSPFRGTIYMCQKGQLPSCKAGPRRKHAVHLKKSAVHLLESSIWKTLLRIKVLAFCTTSDDHNSNSNGNFYDIFWKFL